MSEDRPSMGVVYAIGGMSPHPRLNGFCLLWHGSPTLYIGMSLPTKREIAAVQSGQIVHRFARMADTSYLIYEFGDELIGEAFFSAGLQPDDFTDEALTETEQALTNPTIGLSCIMMLVDTDSNVIKALRHYAWSHVLSVAFIEAAKAQRTAQPEQINFATDVLLRHDTKTLRSMATTASFTLPGRPDKSR